MPSLGELPGCSLGPWERPSSELVSRRDSRKAIPAKQTQGISGSRVIIAAQALSEFVFLVELQAQDSGRAAWPHLALAGVGPGLRRCSLAGAQIQATNVGAWPPSTLRSSPHHRSWKLPQGFRLASGYRVWAQAQMRGRSWRRKTRSPDRPDPSLPKRSLRQQGFVDGTSGLGSSSFRKPVKLYLITTHIIFAGVSASKKLRSVRSAVQIMRSRAYRQKRARTQMATRFRAKTLRVRSWSLRIPEHRKPPQ